jgi:glucan-binding YG repeat protein
MKDRCLGVALCATVLLLLSSSFAAAQETAESSLMERANLLWKALVAEDWATEYQFLSPEEAATITKDTFVSLRKEKWLLRYLSATVGKAFSSNNIGWVEVTLNFRLKNYPEIQPKQRTIWDLWQRKDGQWYRVSEKQHEQVPKLPPHLRPAEEESSLAQRIHAFWQAREQQDWKQVYQYLDPTFQEKTPEEEFLKSRAIYSYLSHRVEWVEVLGENGRAKVAYTYKINDPSLTKLDTQENLALEKWIKVNGQWYRRMAAAATQADGR